MEIRKKQYRRRKKGARAMSMGMRRKAPVGVAQGYGRQKSLGRRIVENRWNYAFISFGIIFILTFCYAPMYGLTLAFKDFKINAGILGSPWSKPLLKNFMLIQHDRAFWSAFFNTFRMGFMYVLTSFPAPILLAILLNELRGARYKKVLQTIYTFPNFLSWVLVSGIFVNLLAAEGFINNIVKLMGGQVSDYLSNQQLIRPLLYGTAIWKGAGWSSILYLAAIAGISQELYEAAEVDGANRFQRVLHITWPGIKPTAVILLILAMGGIMNNGFDQILNMTNAVVKSEAEVMDTYIYRMTFQSTPNYGFSTAMGLGKSVINYVFLLSANKIAKLLGEGGIM